MAEVRIYRQEGEYAAFDPETETMVFGATEEEARANLELEHRELYDEWKLLGPDRLSGHMLAIRRVLEARYG